MEEGNDKTGKRTASGSFGDDLTELDYTLAVADRGLPYSSEGSRATASDLDPDGEAMEAQRAYMKKRFPELWDRVPVSKKHIEKTLRELDQFDCHGFNPDSNSWRDSDTDDSSPRPDCFWRDTEETFDQPMLEEGRVCYATGVQVFSVRIIQADVVDNPNDEFLVYGSVRARDTKDFARNYLFRRESADAIRAKIGDTIPLTGPRRGIAPIGRVDFEFNLNAKRPEEHSKGKPISKDLFEFESEFAGDHQQVLTKIVRGKHGAVEVKYAVFSLAASAVVQIMPVSGSRRDDLYGRISARIVGLPKDKEMLATHGPAETVFGNEMVLFDSAKYNEVIAYDYSSKGQEVIKLWCRVVIVPRGCELLLRIQLDDGRGVTTSEKLFAEVASGTSKHLGDCLTAKVSWSPLFYWAPSIGCRMEARNL